MCVFYIDIFGKLCSRTEKIQLKLYLFNSDSVFSTELELKGVGSPYITLWPLFFKN